MTKKQVYKLRYRRVVVKSVLSIFGCSVNAWYGRALFYAYRGSFCYPARYAFKYEW